jgi:hypothetical protein
MKMRKVLSIGVAAFGLSYLALPAGALAQTVGFSTRKFSVEGRGGIAVPASDLHEIYDIGPSFGVGAAYYPIRWVGIRVDGDVDILSGKDAADVSGGAQAPDIRLWHYNAGLEVTPLLASSTPTRWTIVANVGVGATTIDTDDFPASATGLADESSFNETYFSANGGLKVGYDVTPQLNVFVGGQAYLIATDEQDTRSFAQFDSQVDPNGFSTAWTFPIYGGVRFKT